MNYGDGFRERLRVRRVLAKSRWEWRRLVAPVVVDRVALRNAPPFELWQEKYRYFVHTYNMTWRNERAVEIPIARRFLSNRTGIGLEFGNVLAHYGGSPCQVIVDKYERAPDVRNVDILDYSPAQQFDYIVSISTLEHVGWDERPRDSKKVSAAFSHLLGLLAPGGIMLLTVPIGHHPALDETIAAGRWPAKRQATLVRVDRTRNLWVQSPEQNVRPYAAASKGHGVVDAIWIAEITPPPPS